MSTSLPKWSGKLALTLNDYDIRLNDRIGGVPPENRVRLTTAVRYRAINDALQQVSLERAWPWLRASATISVVGGTATYSLPARFLMTDSIVDPSIGFALRRLSAIEIAELIGTGRPEVYHVDGTLITLGPSPDGSYTLTHTYRAAEPALSASTDTPLIPDAFALGVVSYAAALCFRTEQLPDLATEAFSDYGSWLRRAQDNVNMSREPIKVRVRPGGFV